MGCCSSAISDTEQLREDKIRLLVSNQQVQVNYDSSTDINGSQNAQSSPVKTGNYGDFKDIDEHARQAPRSVEYSIETLAKYLAKPAKNDIEVVRPLYVWICENIRAIGITCKKISGYAQGYNYNPGDITTYNPKTNHAWNIVQLNGVWRFIETTWGSGHVDKNQKFIKQFSNFFFLTPPEAFIYDHYPYFNNNIEESKQLQLLESPIQIEKYSRNILSRQYGVKFASHPCDTILVNDSPCTIEVETKATIFQNCWYDIYEDTGLNSKEAAILLCESGKECKTTVRPPHKGKYKLQLHATIENKNTTLVDYIINCGVAEPNWKPYLKIHGPTPDFIDRGFESFCINPFYTCEDGKFNLLIKTTSTPEVLVALHDAENVDHEDYYNCRAK